MTTSTDPTTDTQPATDIDLLEMLAKARREGCPRPIRYSIYVFGEMAMHVQDHDQAQRWIDWLTAAGAERWTVRRRQIEPHIHQQHVGLWRGAEITVGHLVEIHAEVTAP